MNPARQARLNIANDPLFIPACRSFVETLSGTYGLDEQDAQELAEALGIYLTVLFEFGYDPGDESTVEVRCESHQGTVSVVIHDTGLPFDEVEVREELRENPRLARLGKLVDRLHFQAQGLDGNEFVLVKFRDRPLAQYDSMRIRPDSPKPESAEIRDLEEDDCAGVARCVYRCYGYVYGGLEAVYFPQRLWALNQEGRVHSKVAVTPDGEVVGHIALERSSPTDRVAQVGVAAVVPRFRDQGLGKRLSDVILAEARERGLEGLTAFAVTSHIYSQKLLARYGFQPTGLLLGVAPFTFRGVDTESAQRETLVGAYLNLGGSGPERLYPPMRHRAMIETLCASLGWTGRCFKPEGSLHDYETTTKLACEDLPRRHQAKLAVSGFGPELVDKVKSQVHSLRLRNYRQLTIALPLTHPATYFVCGALEKIGFLFSALIPTDNGAVLLLQYLNGVAIDYEKLAIESPMSRELLGYIRYLDPEDLDL